MKVRKLDYEANIDEVVSLMNRCFPKEITKEHFIWKHTGNPFGRSLGLVAIEDGKIVGLRMFMKWKFTRMGKTLNAIRPVDTCTDPDYRQKGIFTELMAKGLEESKGEYDFIFNTPNSQSIKGNLRLGWQRFNEPLFYNLGFVNPFSNKRKFEFLKLEVLDMQVLSTCSENYTTNISCNYLKWRYRSSRYRIVRFKDDTVVIFRLEEIKGMKVIVILEFCGERLNINSYLNSLALEQGAFWFYYLENKSSADKEFSFSLKRGKQDVVLKNIGNEELQYLKFSAGDLEGIM